MMEPGYKGDPKDKQSIFNFVLNFIRQQGEPSYGENEHGQKNCWYRLGRLCCAAGCLISDSDYNPKLDAIPASGLTSSDCPPSNPASVYFRSLGFDLSFLQELQGCHDGSTGGVQFHQNEDFLKDFEVRMLRVADVYGLEYVAP